MPELKTKIAKRLKFLLMRSSRTGVKEIISFKNELKEKLQSHDNCSGNHSMPCSYYIVEDLLIMQKEIESVEHSSDSQHS